MLKISDTILCISWGDLKLYKQLFGANKMVYFPTYLGELKEVDVKDKKVLDVFYMGSNFSNSVNRSGANYLIKKIIPLVNKELPGKFRFHITGKFSKEIYGKTGIPNLIVYGFIDNLESFYDKMDIACLPVKGGRGLKLKVLEALKKGVPTIGFRKTFSGIPYQENCFICAEYEKEYLQAFKKLRSLSFRQELSQNSKKKIAELTNKEYLLSCLKSVLNKKDSIK
jgi:glycosyltransferase involved in cell wall biosynthesis